MARECPVPLSSRGDPIFYWIPALCLFALKMLIGWEEEVYGGSGRHSSKDPMTPHIACASLGTKTY